MGNFNPTYAPQKQCKGCVYWRGANGRGGIGSTMCHHMLDTGKRRIDNDGVCGSRTTPFDKVKKVIVEAPKKENKVKKRVMAIEDGLVFDSMTEAEKHYKLAHGRVHQVTNNPKKTARGQHFVTV